MVQLTLLVALLVTHFSAALGASGERLSIFQECQYFCKLRICKSLAGDDFVKPLPFYMQLTHRTCRDKCRYDCMWKTVEAFQKDWHPEEDMTRRRRRPRGLPKFYGRWPFVRLLGMEQPASVILSIGNAIPNIIMLRRFRREVPKYAPMYWIVHIYSAVCINAWFWSAIFHTQNSPLSTMMHCFSGISLVYASNYGFVVRFFGTDKTWKPLACGVPFLYLYFGYLYAMLVINFDFGYHVNCVFFFGITNILGWLLWSFVYRSVLKRAWILRAALFYLFCTNFLQLYDFYPIWWVFDAHSMWHASTIPVIPVWYNIFIEDCNYRLMKMKQKQVAKYA